MIATRCPERVLSELWRIFNGLGITDDLTIIEHLAFLLLVWHADLYAKLKAGLQDQIQKAQLLSGRAAIGSRSSALDAASQNLCREWDIDGEELPTPPGTVPDDRLLAILRNLEDALEKLTPAQLLNHCLLFRLPDRLAGGRYPTPRHITQTMASLVNLGEGQSLADLACGSGGLLVAAADKQPQVTGIEISPNLARVAWANVALHDLPVWTIHTANALSIYARMTSPPTFDCVLMNPSFGVPVDRSVLQNTTLEPYGTRSETLLTAQALAVLKPGGRLAVLLPAGSLFTSSTGELALRRGFLEKHHLRAVIALNKDALQPYSTISSFILLADKRLQASDPPTSAVWFYGVVADGLTPGRNRQPDPDHNDLPLVEAAVQAQGHEPDHRLDDGNGRPLLEAKRLQDKDGLRGYCFTRQAEGTLRIKRLGSPSAPAATLLAELRNPAPIGHLLVRDGIGYSGLAEPAQITLQLPDLSLPAGHYQLPEEHNASLIIEENNAHLRVGKQTHNLQPCAGDADDRPIWFVVDNEGLPISAALTAEANILPSALRPNPVVAIPLTLEDGEPAGHLIVANAPLVSAVPLSTSDSGQIHLTELSSGEVFLWEQENGELRQVQVLDSEPVFEGDKRHAGVAVDRDGSWFGVQVPVAEIEPPTYDLQPATYFPEEAAERERRSPAQLLGDIKTHQQQLQRHIDYLLGMVEMQPIAAIHLPPAVEDTVQPMGHLAGVQKIIWERIQQTREPLSAENRAERFTPTPFQLQQISDGLPSANVQRTLDLFERMGLIVRVAYEGAPYYRLVADRDLVKQEDKP